MTREDIKNIINTVCPNDEDFEKSIISPAYLKQELEVLALEQEPIDYKTQYEEFSKKAEIVISQLRADRDRLLDVLGKIRAEIEELDNKLCQQFLIEDIDREVHRTYRECIDIIDKYAESEGK